MTAREPSTVEVIAEAVRRHRLREVGGGTATGSRWTCYCGESDVTPGVREHAVTLHSRHVADTTDAALKAAGFVVATRDEIRAMSPSEQAELIGGEVERVVLPVHEGIYLSGERTWDRVVGPWREVQP